MKIKLFQKATFKKSPRKEIHPQHFKCLKENDVITAKISDHHPIIHDGVLFWNIMMQCKTRNGRTGISYNNGFGMIENDEKYITRLKKVANVIAEIVYRDPSIDVITLCEGPILPLHVDALFQTLKNYPSMNKFFIGNNVEDIHKPNVEEFSNWGLLMLANKKYKIHKMTCDFLENSTIFSKLANRFQIWQLTNNIGQNKYVTLGHFPFGGDEKIAENQKLSVLGNMYCDLVRKVINHYSHEQFVLCADFNLNPYLISEWKDRAMDLITNHNSILLTTEEKSNKAVIEKVTVDGILLSPGAKQRYYSSQFDFGLFSRLKQENVFFQSNVREHIMQNHHKRPKARIAHK